MKDIPLESEIEMRRQFRKMYLDIGYEESLTVLYGIVASANILIDIMLEEAEREKKENR